jgi:hypothetical protein
LIGNLSSGSTTTQGTLTGLSANTYFTYIIAKNAVGNSHPTSQITTVYTTTVNSDGLGATVWNGNMYVASTTGNIYRVDLTNTTNTSTNWAIGQTGNYGVAVYNGYIYSVGLSNNTVSRININNPLDVSSNFIDWSANTNLSTLKAYSAYAHKNYLYIGYDNGKISRVNLDNTNDYQIFWYDTPQVVNSINGIVGYENELYFALATSGIYKCSSSGSSAVNTTFVIGINNDAVYGMTIQWPYLFYSLYTSRNIRYVNLTNYSDHSDYAIPMALSNNSGMVAYNNKLYWVAFQNSTVTVVNLPVNVQTTPVSFNSSSVTSTTSGNIDISITDSSNNIYNLVKYSYYLYDSGTNNSNVLSAYTHSGLTRYDGNTTIYTFSLSGLTNKQYSVYLIGNNTVGNTEPVMSNVVVYTTPFTPTIDSTSSTSAGSLVVNISDTVNSSTNQVYYQYSTDGTTYGNTGVLKSSSNTYSFTISDTGSASVLLTDVNYTLFVRTINPVAFSSAASTSAIVYQTPRTPSAVTTESNESGNISVTVTETSPPAFYYLNNVYYYYYLYNGTGQNDSGNSLAYTNSLVALSSASNTTQFKIQGQAANNYTVYVIAKNTVGNSDPPATGNYVTVQTTPVSFNSFTAVNNTSGNINLTINDTSNNIYNSVNYFYYLYVSGTNESSNNSLYTDTGITKNASGNTYTYQIPNLSANQYTVYLLAKNSVGYSQPLTQTVNVYTTPVPPTIVSTNSTEAGNLTINLFDDQNSATNDVYYLYSTNGTTYGNLGVLKTSGNTYSFTINNTGNASVPLTDISYTVFVQSINSMGVSQAVSQSAIVHQIPNTPSVLSVTSTESGNVYVTVTETNPPVNYYLNNVYYYYYLYNGVGQNQSGNNLAYSNSYAMVTSASNTTSFKIQGEPANNYTLYVIAKNTVGDSSPTSGNVAIKRTPPVNFTSYTVTCTSAGNINITITDNANDVNNAVGYYYYVYDSDSGTNNSGNILAYTDTGLIRDNDSTTTYSYNIPGFTNKEYTVYLVAKNILGSTVPVSSPVTVLITPLTPSILSTNSYAPGTLLIDISDNVNLLTNGVFYNYSFDGITYGNSGVAKTADTTYQLTISDTGNASVLLTKPRYPTLYVRAQNTAAASHPATIGPVEVYQIICFNHDTQIFTNKGYRKIQELKKGDLVKTYKHGFKKIYLMGKKEFTHRPTPYRSKDHLYRCSKSQYPELLEDLIITGCHSVLVDDYVDEAQYNRVIEVNGEVYITDDKYRLPVCADERASIYEQPGKYTVYHIALENERYCGNYGIYANGLLVESTSKRFLEETDIMNTY